MDKKLSAHSHKDKYFLMSFSDQTAQRPTFPLTSSLLKSFILLVWAAVPGPSLKGCSCVCLLFFFLSDIQIQTITCSCELIPVCSPPGSWNQSNYLAQALWPHTHQDAWFQAVKVHNYVCWFSQRAALFTHPHYPALIFHYSSVWVSFSVQQTVVWRSTRFLSMWSA